MHYSHSFFPLVNCLDVFNPITKELLLDQLTDASPVDSAIVGDNDGTSSKKYYIGYDPISCYNHARGI